MDAVECLRTVNRMCYELNCSICPLNDNKRGFACTNLRRKYPEEYVAIVEKWAQEHPDNTKSKKFVIRLDTPRLSFQRMSTPKKMLRLRFSRN